MRICDAYRGAQLDRAINNFSIFSGGVTGEHALNTCQICTLSLKLTCQIARCSAIIARMLLAGIFWVCFLRPVQGIHSCNAKCWGLKGRRGEIAPGPAVEEFNL
jgi:hypothetical protein